MIRGRLRSIAAAFRGDGVKARALRASGWSLFGVLGTNLFRLLSNLVLTRLLFPEAFGLMALVQVFIYALQTFSDIGIHTSIIQNKRGDDPNFLNTAWTLQILRGVVLWLGSCALAWPASLIYDQPELLLLLPVTALSMITDGFRPTREAQANRHLSLGRQTMIGLSVQVITLVITGLLAWWLRSVWALAISALISSVLRNLMTRRFMAGTPNRFQWEPQAVKEIFGFGSFIFLSTIASFLINMGDRAILGAYVDLTTLGVYSISLTFAALPGMIVQTIATKVLFPLYRIKPPSESPENQRQIFRARRMVSAVGIAVACLLSWAGVLLVDLLYDDRYALAGPMLVLFGLRSIPNNALVGTQNVLLAAGDSKRNFYLTAMTAAVQTALTLLGVWQFGVVGIILAPAVAILLMYPLRARMTAQYKAWDPVSELGYIAIGFAVTGLSVAWHWPDIVQLLP